MRVIDGKEYFYYSQLMSFEKISYKRKIYYFIKVLSKEYPNFNEWYNRLFEKFELIEGREIIFCLYNEKVIGISILKKTEEEDKICTLRVNKNFQRMSIGKNLIELSLEWLENDKPLVTLQKSRYLQFKKLFEYYGFKIEDEKFGYYKLFSTELSFNGLLEERSILKNNKIEISYIEDIIFKSMQYENFLEAFDYYINKLYEYIQSSKYLLKEEKIFY